jgi:7-cyano-7-deazaguanine synthase
VVDSVWGYEHVGNNPMLNRRIALPEDEVSIVPGRNLLFIALGAAFCQAHGLDQLYTGLHFTTSNVKDSSLVFHNACYKACEAYDVELMSPLLCWAKEKTIQRVKDAGLYDLTWSCYDGKDEPCGKCAACKARGDV